MNKINKASLLIFFTFLFISFQSLAQSDEEPVNKKFEKAQKEQKIKEQKSMQERKKRHEKIQTRKTRKRMKESKKKSRKVNEPKKEFFLIRIFRK